jgi:hypothetical protein
MHDNNEEAVNILRHPTTPSIWSSMRYAERRIFAVRSTPVVKYVLPLAIVRHVILRPSRSVLKKVHMAWPTSTSTSPYLVYPVEFIFALGNDSFFPLVKFVLIRSRIVRFVWMRSAHLTNGAKAKVCNRNRHILLPIRRQNLPSVS